MRTFKYYHTVALVVLPVALAGCSDNLPQKTEIDPALLKDLPPPGPERVNPFAAKGAKSKDHVGDLTPIMPPQP